SPSALGAGRRKLQSVTVNLRTRAGDNRGIIAKGRLRDARAPMQRARAPAAKDPALANAAPQARARSREHCQAPRRDYATSLRSRSCGLHWRTCVIGI